MFGYSVGGKTGTSEPSLTKPEEGYAVSYIAMAPADEPQVVGLVVIYNPATENPYGSKIAAPIMSSILTEVLPYVGLASGNSDLSGITTVPAKTTAVPTVINKTVTEAKKTLENLGFRVITGEMTNANSALVTEQIPAGNTQVLDGATIVLYTADSNVRTSTEVPNVVRKDFE